MNKRFLYSAVIILVTFLVLGNLPLAGTIKVAPTQMKLNITSVVVKTWNSADDAFGLRQGKEGPAFGPASVTYFKNRIFLLDTVKKRILAFDKCGNLVSTIVLPFAEPSDIVADPSSSSILVVAQGSGELCKVNESGVIQPLPSVDTKHLVAPSLFSYETKSATLFGQAKIGHGMLSPLLRNGVTLTGNLQTEWIAPSVKADIRGQSIILSYGNGMPSTLVDMGKAVFCIEEVLVDEQGVIWALYTLVGDYRIRRLLRVDVANKTAGVALIDAWFAFDATRHMAAMDGGVVLFAGDMETGRIVTIEYEGSDR